MRSNTAGDPSVPTWGHECSALLAYIPRCWKTIPPTTRLKRQRICRFISPVITRTGTLDREKKGLIADWLQRVQQLLDAAALENRLGGALFLLEEQLEVIATTLSLQQRLETLRDAGLAIIKTFTVRELRRDRALAKALGFKDSADLRDETEVRSASRLRYDNTSPVPPSARRSWRIRRR